MIFPLLQPRFISLSASLPDLCSELRHSPWQLFGVSAFVLNPAAVHGTPSALHRPPVPQDLGTRSLRGEYCYIPYHSRDFADKPQPVPNLSHPLSHPLALVPPRNSSALEALLSQLHTNSRDSRNLVPRSNSGITNTDLNITIASLVPVPVPVPCSDIAFLCFPSCTNRFPVFRSVFRYVPVPNGYAL